MNKARRLGLALLAIGSAALAHAADYETTTAAVNALSGAAASTTTNYLGWTTLGVGAVLVGTAVWAVRKGIALRK